MPRNKYPEETVQIILDAALKTFAKKGFEEASVLDIVAEMGGLTRGAFYHHFKNKEEVLLALNERLFLDMNPFEAVKEHTELSGLEKIKWVIRLMHASKDFVLVQKEEEKLFASPAVIKMQIDAIRDIMTPLLCTLIEEGIADGSLQVTNPKLTAQLTFLLASFWPIEAMFPTQTLAEARAKLKMIADICAYVGLPAIDEPMMDMFWENGFYGNNKQ